MNKIITQLLLMHLTPTNNFKLFYMSFTEMNSSYKFIYSFSYTYFKDQNY